MFFIYVKTLQGETLKIDGVSPDTTFEQLKALIVATVPEPKPDPSKIRLIFAGKTSEDGRTREQFNIQKESTVHMSVR